MSKNSRYAVYAYERESNEITLKKSEYEEGTFVELDIPVNESVIFKTKGEIGLLFDYNVKTPHESVLLKHGVANLVESAWEKHKVMEGVLEEQGSKLVFIKGQFSVSELNKMINITGYVGTWYSTIINIKGRSELPRNRKSKEIMGVSLA